MSSRDTIQGLIKSDSTESALRQGSDDRNAVKALQDLLHEMGFGTELNWSRYGADGEYGAATTLAVKTFAERNGLPSSEETVTSAIATKLIQRYNNLDDLRHLNAAIENNEVEDFYFKGSPHRVAVMSLQCLLKELGFGAEMNWEKYGADGEYGGGTTKAVQSFGQKEGIPTDGIKVDQVLAQRIVDKLKVYYGDLWAQTGDSPQNTSGNLQIREAIEGARTRVYVSMGEFQVRFSKFKKGVYFTGNQPPMDFIEANRSLLDSKGMTESALNVIISVSENEGNLDAINTWDNSFLTFGMFQWTLGAGGNPGELPALLKKVKHADKDVFQKYFGQYGLDVTDTGQITGYFSINGEKVSSPEKKEFLRSYNWAFYFWLSAHDPVVQTCEIDHALSRLDTFYKADDYRVKGHYIADLITSEYGVALILDNHVNRPGYVRPCLEKAMDETGLDDPGQWSTTEERKLIDAYLLIRKSFGSTPMTDADKRAAVTRKYLDRGTISDKRGSFIYQA